MQNTIVISRSRDQGQHWELESMLAGLCAATDGLDVLLIPHLYHIAEDSAIWNRLSALRGRVVVTTWLYPRPAEWLLRRRGVGGGGRLNVLCLGDFASAEEAYARIAEIIHGDQEKQDRGLTPENPAHHAAPHQGGIVPPQSQLEELAEPVGERWYPVLESASCVNCQNCFQFCLFGVYALDEAGRVRVTNPDQCKPGCPACSRICPQGAIIFPLYARDEAIAGAPGRRMAPDAAARKMFYTRTRKACPVCGSTPDAPGHGESVGVCGECGRAVEQVNSPAGPAQGADGVADYLKDDLDSLLDDLDHLAGSK